MTQEKVVRRVTEYLPDTITKEQAAYLIHSIWPKAPDAEVIKAAILCKQYGLNPLMRQIYLIEFGKEWAIVLGIKATRQIAQQALKKRNIRYSYADGPRVMSEEEQKKIRGKVEADKIWAITILQDNFGNIYPGYGFWSVSKVPYGSDKGNDAFNMAFIRSERNALDKLAPGELPDVETADDAYIIADYKVSLEEGKNQFIQRVEKDIETLFPDGGTVQVEPEHSPQSPEAKTSPAGQGNDRMTPEPTKKAKTRVAQTNEIPEFKTAAELFNYALGHGISVEKIKEKTGYAYPNEVVDLQAAIKALFP